MCVSCTLDLIKDPGVTCPWISVGPPEGLPSCPFDDEPWSPDELSPEVNDTIGEALRMNGSIPIDPNVLLIAVCEDRLDDDTVVGPVDTWGDRSVNDT